MESDWKNNLSVDDKGNLTKSISNYRAIFTHDENLSQIRFDTFCQDDISFSPLFLNVNGSKVDEESVGKIQDYLEQTYQLRLTQNKVFELLKTTASERSYNPVQEFIRVADLTCITSWFLPDGSTMSNGIDGYLADRSDGQPDNHAATPYASSHVYDGKADAASVLGSQSLSDTGRPSARESSVTPIGKSGTPVRSVNRGYATVMPSDLFAGQECREPQKPQSQNGSMVKND